MTYAQFARALALQESHALRPLDVWGEWRDYERTAARAAGGQVAA